MHILYCQKEHLAGGDKQNWEWRKRGRARCMMLLCTKWSSQAGWPLVLVFAGLVLSLPLVFLPWHCWNARTCGSLSLHAEQGCICSLERNYGAVLWWSQLAWKACAFYQQFSQQRTQWEAERAGCSTEGGSEKISWRDLVPVTGRYRGLFPEKQIPQLFLPSKACPEPDICLTYHWAQLPIWGSLLSGQPFKRTV